MGCDIHGMLEVYQDGEWRSVMDPEENPYFADPYESEYLHMFTSRSPYSTQDYTVFSALANVRTYHEPCDVREPRGIPDDLARATLDELEYWESDGHSHSWYTLAELLELDMSATKCADPDDESETSVLPDPVGFWERILPAMLSQGVGPDDVRWIFWFDN